MKETMRHIENILLFFRLLSILLPKPEVKHIYLCKILNAGPLLVSKYFSIVAIFTLVKDCSISSTTVTYKIRPACTRVADL